jgi:hypothetical protein
MAIWRTLPVGQEPTITLVCWRIVRLPNGDRHFVGYNRLRWEGRVSNVIAAFSQGRSMGRTRSGRIYRLEGDAGRHSDADYVLGRWCAINGVEPASLEDVTAADLADLPIFE